MRSSHQSTLHSEIQKESNFGIERKFIHSEFNNRSVTKNNIFFFNTFNFIYDMPGHRSAVTHAASTVAELAQAITGPEPDFISQTDRRQIISDTDLANMITFQSGPKLLKQLDTVGNGRFPHPVAGKADVIILDAMPQIQQAQGSGDFKTSAPPEQFFTKADSLADVLACQHYFSCQFQFTKEIYDDTIGPLVIAYMSSEVFSQFFKSRLKHNLDRLARFAR